MRKPTCRDRTLAGNLFYNEEGRGLLTPEDDMQFIEQVMANLISSHVEAESKKLEEALEAMVMQHCEMADGTLDSMAISANCDAMDLLECLEKIEIDNGIGRRRIGKWATPPEQEGE